VFPSLKKTVYYPGCLTLRKLKDVYYNYKAIMCDLGIDFVVLDELKCCGYPALFSGYREDFEKLRDENKKLLRKHHVEKIITNCPHCMRMFKEFYNIPVEHISQTLAREKAKIPVLNEEEHVNFHDPCNLARIMHVTSEPRQVLKASGFRIFEMPENKERTLCCGSGCNNLKRNFPDLADKIAKTRIGQADQDTIITCCPYCYEHMKSNSKNIKVKEMSEVLVE
jgi:Fe-S oxidoreductase